MDWAFTLLQTLSSSSPEAVLLSKRRGGTHGLGFSVFAHSTAGMAWNKPLNSPSLYLFPHLVTPACESLSFLKMYYFILCAVVFCLHVRVRVSGLGSEAPEGWKILGKMWALTPVFKASFQVSHKHRLGSFLPQCRARLSEEKAGCPGSKVVAKGHLLNHRRLAANPSLPPLWSRMWV